MTNKKWPPPGFPLVEGEHQLTDDWTIHLPEKFALRVEDGSLVLWRPGLTIWLAAWNNDRRQTQAERLNWIKEEASAERYAESESTIANVTRYSYRLRDETEDGPVESVYGFVISENGHVQLAIYFDDPQDEATARKLIDTVTAA